MIDGLIVVVCFFVALYLLQAEVQNVQTGIGFGLIPEITMPWDGWIAELTKSGDSM